ncbi:LacI family DNA-binding transcriptional regulator [Clostridium sp. 'deep sea']|uniref:LacI family DNA-binding transcriptional regulator n=1 Tax=Clostridium sp. 'deep sea' TaxID=2779445 RepID=UPI00189646CB|nr:LacI family DNA-binding transcriptional regulator [Clostridium sp. 'deep sea']QOR34070.1 LacI family DNA-binding transcriptional regulator [Clostridium sp. 'deep sea']
MDSRDIAKLAGVSRSTVSRVINNHPSVSVDTRAKILKIIKDQGYVPDSSARALVGKQNNIIGLFIINADGSDEAGIFSSNYYSPFTAAVIDEANKNDYQVLVSLQKSKADYEQARKLLRNKSINAAIFVGAEDNSVELKKLINDGYCVALVDQSLLSTNKNNNAVVINSNNLFGSYEATNYLINCGHKQIAHITGNLKKLSGLQRYEGYINALKDNNIVLNDKLIIESDFSEQGGYISTKKLLQTQDVDAIFIANDSMALGALKALNELRIKVPENIAIVGYDDIDIARYLGLSTVRASIHEMASVAVKQLINIIEGKLINSVSNVVDCKLIIRKTSK